MTPKLARALVVVTVFTLLTVLSATRSYVTATAFRAAPAVASPQSAPPPGAVFGSRLHFYLMWAAVAPGILWLGRRVPLGGPSWAGPVAFHLAVPAVASVPFLGLRMVVAAAMAPGVFHLSPPRPVVLLVQPLVVLPAYWLVLALGTAVRLVRQQATGELRTAMLQRSLAAAQLDALKMRAQPHVLFNTLNAVASLAQAGDTEAVIQVVDRLGTLLRLSMEASARQVVRLEEELALLDEYLAIEEVRFKERLRVVRRVDPEARDVPVPNLILQPLVENALRHGLGRRLEARVIEISAHRDGEWLCLAVRDDGPGLPAGWTLASNAGAGLRNVMERLDGLYGGRARLELVADPEGGTRARLTVPAMGPRTPA